MKQHLTNAIGTKSKQEIHSYQFGIFLSVKMRLYFSSHILLNRHKIVRKSCKLLNAFHYKFMSLRYLLLTSKYLIMCKSLNG